MAESVRPKLYIVTLCDILVLGGWDCISDTKEDMKGGFLPAVA